jgi:hypothetical protein
MAGKDQAALKPVDDPEEQEEVDIDLDAIDETLRREAVGQPVTVRIDGKVIHITNAGEWTSSAMRAMTSGDFETWAREVIDDDKEYETWENADLRNYQIEAIALQCARKSRLGQGKSRGRSGSSSNSRRR